MALLRGLVVGFGTFSDVKVGCAVPYQKGLCTNTCLVKSYFRYSGVDRQVEVGWRFLTKFYGCFTSSKGKILLKSCFSSAILKPKEVWPTFTYKKMCI